jgi:hypothetical protein
LESPGYPIILSLASADKDNADPGGIILQG